MYKPIGIAVCLLVSGIEMNAQAPAPVDSDAPATGRCSNEALKLSLKAVKTPGPLHRMSQPEPIPVWDGLIEVRLKNVSSLVVHLKELAADWEYEVSVLDISGKSVPMTEYGRKLTPGKIPTGGDYMGPTSSLDLSPSQETGPRLMYLSRIYQIEPGQAYTVTLKREAGLPKVDQIGRALKHPGLSCSLTISAGPLSNVQ